MLKARTLTDDADVEDPLSSMTEFDEDDDDNGDDAIEGLVI